MPLFSLSLVLTLGHVTGKLHGGGGGGSGRSCVVYSLAYHHKETCLLTAGSFGPVKAWKGQGWSPSEKSRAPTISVLCFFIFPATVHTYSGTSHKELSDLRTQYKKPPY